MKKTLSISLMFCLMFFACFLLSCGKKEPEPPKAPQWRVEPPPPKPPEPQKPPEPAKHDVQEVKETQKPRETEKPVPEKHEKQILKKKTPPQKPKAPAMPAASSSKKPASSQIVSLDRLNQEFKTYHLNVWASEWSNKGILLNGYVKSEREREDALSLARRYNPNVTDMINVVTVYDNTTPSGNR
jgi:hypothetical protein